MKLHSFQRRIKAAFHFFLSHSCYYTIRALLLGDSHNFRICTSFTINTLCTGAARVSYKYLVMTMIIVRKKILFKIKRQMLCYSTSWACCGYKCVRWAIGVFIRRLWWTRAKFTCLVFSLGRIYTSQMGNSSKNVCLGIQHFSRDLMTLMQFLV